MRLPLWRLSKFSLRAGIVLLPFLAVTLEVFFCSVCVVVCDASWGCIDGLACVDVSKIFKSHHCCFAVVWQVACFLHCFFSYCLFIAFRGFFDVHTVLRFCPCFFHFALWSSNLQISFLFQKFYHIYVLFAEICIFTGLWRLCVFAENWIFTRLADRIGGIGSARGVAKKL